MNKTKWQWLLARFTRRMWFRASLFCLLGVFTALLAVVVDPYLPDDLQTSIGADAVDNILGIIASSMLSVTTFSLSTMVAAYAAATSSVTPRATRLLMEDSTTQNVLATFIGSFLFSLVGIIALSTGAYGERGRVVLFAVTVLVIVFILVTLLRWIDHLSRLGRVTETIDRVEEEVAGVLRERHREPFLGGRPLSAQGTRPVEGPAVFAAEIGYVQHVDMSRLDAAAASAGCEIVLDAIPGTFVDRARPIARLAGPAPEEALEAVRDAFTIARHRSFVQDPRFGMAVLAEIAERALSPGINDPGTAIDVLGRAVRLLSIWAEPGGTAEVAHASVYVPPVMLAELFDDVFAPIAREGTASVTVQIRLHKSLRALACLDDPAFAQEALRHSDTALRRSESEIGFADDLAPIREAAATVREACAGR